MKEIIRRNMQGIWKNMLPYAWAIGTWKNSRPSPWIRGWGTLPNFHTKARLFLYNFKSLPELELGFINSRVTHNVPHSSFLRERISDLPAMQKRKIKR